jgi:hypothetical protein
VRFVFAAVLATALLVPAAEARVEVTLDAGSLNELIGSMAPDKVAVRLGGERSIDIGLADLRVTGFDPAGGKNGEGVVLTSLRLKVAALGLDLPVTPQLSLQFREANGKKVAYLRFEEVRIELPLTGGVDLAALLPLLPITTDTTWVIDSQRGKLRVSPRLTDAKLGQRNLRLGFELDVLPVAGAPAGGK